MLSSRNITETSCGVFGSMEDEGIRATKAYSYLKNGLDGSNSIGFTLKDCHNFINKKGERQLVHRDCQSVLGDLIHLQAKGKKMFIILYKWMINLE